ncbi:hypothetical protein ACFYYS_39235, partial [Streptomyces sp. NPDC002120]|uniref:hypothetical protein n=1 Tax=Streptomyces sp. NPDC002120 TaxID=3364631 RepID=UPI0036C3ED3C
EVDGVSTSGVDFWHAVEFSRNGRFLCTHPLGFSSGLSFCSAVFLRSQLYQIISAPFPALDLNSVTVGGLCLSALHHVSAYPLPFIIE